MPDHIKILTSYVPSQVVRRVAADPAPITEPQAERFPAAVLFADISGFTPLTERLAQRGPAGAEEMSHLLDAYFGQLIDLITAHVGMLLSSPVMPCWLSGPLLRRRFLQ